MKALLELHARTAGQFLNHKLKKRKGGETEKRIRSPITGKRSYAKKRRKDAQQEGKSRKTLKRGFSTGSWTLLKRGWGASHRLTSCFKTKTENRKRKTLAISPPTSIWKFASKKNRPDTAKREGPVFVVVSRVCQQKCGGKKKCRGKKSGISPEASLPMQQVLTCSLKVARGKMPL